MTEFARLYTPADCGKDGYPPAWHEHVKDWVREQAGHRCVRCHHPYRKGEHGRGEWSPCDELCTHGGPVRVERDVAGGVLIERPDPEPVRDLIARGFAVEARWRILTVHHLNGDKYDCRWWNLASLCQRCHLTIQGRVQMQRVWPWEHSEWFRPYAAGYYAWAYRGEDISRDEALARMDELLALERAA